MKFHSAVAAAALCCPLSILAPTSGAHAQTLADIQDKTLPPNSYYNGADGAGGFTSRGVFFNNAYDPASMSWEGFSYSDTTDTTTPGFTNQYSAIAGSGAGGSSLYAVAFGDSNFPRITLPAGQDRPLSIALTNTTYDALSMRDGDSFSKKFGGASGNDPDYFLLTISAFDASNALLGSVNFYLADFRFADNSQDYIVTNWATVSLSGLGAGVRSLGFSFASSDTGRFGINTPTYVAVDNLLVVPEPSALTWLALGGGLLAIAAAPRRRRLPHPDAPDSFESRCSHGAPLPWLPPLQNASTKQNGYNRNTATGRRDYRAEGHIFHGKALASLALGLMIAALVPSAARAGGYSLALNDPTNPFDPPVPGFTGPAGVGTVSGNILNLAFVGWATTIAEYSPAAGVSTTWSNPNLALGPVTGDNFDIVSLGDLSRSAIDSGAAPGRITLGFGTSIRNGAGADFAVFENSFLSQIDNGVFGELAYVEVSTNGINFARFPNVSLTTAPVGAFGSFDPTNVFGLAGKHVNAGGQSWGTPFDLSALTTDPLVTSGLLDLGNVRFVRLVDVPGSGDFKDSAGRSIYDAWLTTDSGGFDLEAIGVLNQVPEPGSLLACGVGAVMLLFLMIWRLRQARGIPVVSVAPGA